MTAGLPGGQSSPPTTAPRSPLTVAQPECGSDAADRSFSSRATAADVDPCFCSQIAKQACDRTGSSVPRPFPSSSVGSYAGECRLGKRVTGPLWGSHICGSEGTSCGRLAAMQPDAVALVLEVQSAGGGVVEGTVGLGRA